MNKNKQSIVKLLERLWAHISGRRKMQFWVLLLLMVLSSFAEVLNIGAIMPFLGILVAPEKIYSLPSLQPVILFFGITSPSELLLPCIVLFGILVVVANAMRLSVIWYGTRLTASVGAELSLSVYRRTLYQPYIVHVSRNSSDVIGVVINKVNLAVVTVSMVINLVGAFIMLTAILSVILLINPLVAIAAFGGFGLIYLVIARLMRFQLASSSERIAVESTRVLKTLQEGLGGIRDVLLDGTQELYIAIFHTADFRARRAQGNIEIISFTPRYAVEALGLVLILILAYNLASENSNISGAIPVLGALALGAQRMLPVLQLAYSSLTGIRGNKFSLQDVLDMLDQPLPRFYAIEAFSPLPFNDSITLKKVGFHYSPDSNWVLKNIDLVIPRGGRIGFIGKTGGGKSTLLDLIMGLLPPSEGVMEVDGTAINELNCRGWQCRIAHVPQLIYLADSSIEQNIAFGIPAEKIDYDRVKLAAHRAQISGAIEGWPMKYKTLVGERGVRLSGGQRQRIGIARALYKQADLIIFDEATSALDSDTEQDVMEAIEGLSKDLTILIIAHRLTTLKNCTKIVEVADGTIKCIGSYDEIINHSL
jgi:ABC-type multidrug transport system fused ATPase/permease subunit